MKNDFIISDFVVGQSYLINIKDWESPMGELIKGNAKVRTVLKPLPKDHELGRLMLRVYNHDREREHLIALEEIESVQLMA